MRVVIAGGGTTGHLSPGLALAAELQASGDAVMFIGSGNGPEAEAVPARGFDFAPIEIIGRRRGLSPRNILALAKLGLATLKARRIVRRFKGDVVVGTGGYVSLPVCFAARSLRIPVVLHEQNSVPGLANRVASRFAAAVGVSFPGSEEAFGPMARLTGNPVTPEIESMDRQALRAEAALHFELHASNKTLLVMGGSQGAASLNQAAVGAYDLLRDAGLQILHLTGPAKVEAVLEEIGRVRVEGDPPFYRAVGYTDRMDLAYSLCELAICRAGASTIAELAAVGIPGVLVPLPGSIDQDQLKNARYAQERGGALLLEDADLTAQKLSEVAKTLIFDSDRLSRMASGMNGIHIKGAAKRLAELVRGTVL
ncbi:MAG TPA: undecaprenyldiphospho-muramoylpentapeptide beta-N-acetylglucosaminyltransferase [Actinomycetota bacterium]|nr:undecaprenyldiphospho-muramoylpentapeptide beta-N-acetylglucosaminyltransferase [Actinomycetota bacterium]